jgi:hypothetical protein
MIEGLSDTEPNSNIGTYTGTYTTTDPSEKVYTYKFDLYDDANVLIATSGECLHNSSKDTSTTTSSDEWSMQYSLSNK